MILWQVKKNNEYVTMQTPSRFHLDGEDLDEGAYRSIANGKIVRPNIIGKKWQSAKFSYNYLTESEAEELVSTLNIYPMEVKFKSPMFSTDGMFECECYCSKFSIDMQQNKETGATWSELTFTLVQGKKVSGQ